jgi:hypothetical protein
MANESTVAQRIAQEAIDEASRTIAESSRRTGEQAQEATRTVLDLGTEVNRNLLNTWLATSDALWRALFELQNAQRTVALAWWQNLAESSRAGFQVTEQWDGVTRQAQRAALDSFEATTRGLVRSVEQGADSASRGSGTAR